MIPENIARVEGLRLNLRLIQVEDAEYVHQLRTDPIYNNYLSEVYGSSAVQRTWIEAYKAREAELRELYYVIERPDGTRCGVVRLYEISERSFTWGSWILDHNKTPKAALESALLVYVSAFERLGLADAQFDVRRDNEGTLAFHRRFGAVETHETDRDIYFTYTRGQFEADKAGFLAILGAGG